MQKYLAGFALAICLSGCGETPPFDIDTYDQWDDFYKRSYVKIKISATTQQIEIQDIIVNRGNCERREAMGYRQHLPKKLDFGEYFTTTFLGPCEAKQVDVFTDLGEWTWSYK